MAARKLSKESTRKKVPSAATSKPPPRSRVGRSALAGSAQKPSASKLTASKPKGAKSNKPKTPKSAAPVVAAKTPKAAIETSAARATTAKLVKSAKPSKPARSRGHAARSNQLAHLPKRIMLDSPIVIMALEYDNPRRQTDPKVQDARELWERALVECTVLLPPFVVLDLLLGGVQAPLPALRNLMHVAFTYEVAESMSSWASAPLPTKATARKAGTRNAAARTPNARDGMRYEALIVGTAKFYGAEVLVTHDAATAALATAAGLRVADPSALLRWTQRGLPGIEA
jgi:hypothetical protein